MHEFDEKLATSFQVLDSIFISLAFLLYYTHYSQDSMGKGVTFLVPLYHFHPLNEH